MISWIILGIYIAGFIWGYRVIFRFAVDVMWDDDPEDIAGRVLTAVMSMLMATMWPIGLPGWLVYKLATPKTNADRRREIEELSRQKIQLQQEIDTMERQLGMT